MNSKKFLISGFLVGFIGVFVSTLGLAIRIIEIVAQPFLYPTKAVLAGFDFQTLPGLLSILIFAVVSGVVYAIIFFLTGKIVSGFGSNSSFTSPPTSTPSN